MKKKKVWDRKIPTVFAFAILFISVWITISLIQKGAFIIGRASPDLSPQHIEISNITDTSFTVTFTTLEKVAAGITLDDFGGTLILDDRDKSSGNQQGYYSHHITVPNLKANTSYQFSIISNSNIYLNDGKKFVATTASSLTETPLNQKPLYGRVLLPDSSHADDTVLNISINGAQPVSQVTKNTGEYIIPMNSLRDEKLEHYFQLQDSTVITIHAFRRDLESTVTVFYKDSSFIPPITLSKNYNFTSENNQVTQTTASSSSLLKLPTTQNANGIIQIVSPPANVSLIDQRPVFSGTALPNKKVNINISDFGNQLSVIADANGNWSFRPSLAINPGQHTITIQSQDASGISQQAKQSFTIFSSGTQVAETATPSATPIPTEVPTVIPTAIIEPTAIPTSAITPTVSVSTSPTSIPTITVEATIEPTAIPTIIPPTQIVESPTSFVQVTPGATGSTSTILLTFISVLFILTGTSLLFLLG